MNPFRTLIDLLMPRICHLCGTHLLCEESFICNDCLKKLPVTGYEKYWSNTNAPNSDLNPMEERFAGQIPLDRACSPFFYTRDSAMASLVHDFKYRNFPDLARVMGRHGASLLIDSGFFNDVDILLPVPLHWTKRWRRGYNQSEMIAAGISDITGIPVGKNLQATKPHRTQTSLSALQRIENTRNVFRLARNAPLTGKSIMLVDDICTTGATLLAASDAIVREIPETRLKIFTLGVV